MDAEQLRPADPVTRPIGARPRAMRCGRSADGLWLSFPWRGLAFVGLSLLGACCLGAAGAIAVLGHGPQALVGVLGAAAPGVVAAYVGLAGMLNRTTIDVTAAWVAVRHGPVPLVRGVRIPAARVAQLHVWALPLGARTGPVTRVWALTHDGRRVPLTWYVHDDRAGIAAFVERRVERQLRIVDRPVVCPQCGYDLRAARRRCPGCGLRVRTAARPRG